MVEVVLPVLNEAAALPWVLGRMPDGYTPIVVDNGSTDGSGELAAALGTRVVVEQTPGFGAACWAGLLHAEGRLVAFMDADASLDPRDLPALADRVERGEADLVLGARVPQRGAWPPHARLGNRLIAWEIRRRTGCHLRDLGPMRVARRRDLLGLDLRDRRFGWPFEMVLAAAAAGWRIEELEVAYLARRGRSKVTGTVRGTARALHDLARVLR